MALSKKIVTDNGVTLAYHRVVSVNCITNQQNIIEVCGYISADAREKEKEAAAAMIAGTATEPANIYTSTQYITCEYDPAMTIDKAYAYLKTLEDFAGANDVTEAD